jgi:hypothetical protein
MPVTVQIGRTRSSALTFIRITGSACGSWRAWRLAPTPSASSRTRASLNDIGALTIDGSEIASARSMRRAPGSEAHPGVSGSPGTMKS